MNQSLFNTDTSDERIVTQRRDFLKMGLAGVIGSVLPLFSIQNAFAANKNTPWKISFRNAHTGESFSGVYRVGNKYLPEAFERINYVMRDFRTKEVFPMDPHVVDIMAVIHRKMDTTTQYQVLSAYRSPKTNAMLGKRSVAVASNSFHMYGQAVDIRLEGESTKKIRNIAQSLKAGGVGFYPRSTFVHVDTGSVRTWTS